ncbi:MULTISPECIES: ABC transporter substrate-binding protein [Bosea]|jgi:peptide/nickel transport system substrate-binding protein|uniref:ABC transporter substrate-binding protein n=1 Tax=Bosea TaxID=85413 RepID=UPI00214F8B08|nr:MULTISPECIES: ABC transporter substrate-binding protein [Bosea]MCR4523839.1 ABC transporter substrate-binding protein [Bosea sp. 47.2.35]MDR6830343.1 peptide/nickel transport system substrate-binding protein [Bosea robiniae]MDR6897098.1 peptide/nickel transport system substrate-binding protein [Bosea sp. BE109]MDR7140495.1 peptide/nickel transport system substrate-binding protein [Bosea sp. BE168]MDR7177184.1 peptide/nickel transport system substrate-binding protein [Bosea sp. BE271]
MKKAWLLAAVAAFALTGAAEAKTLKWGASREIASLDPYSYGETFTLSVLNHVYEGLVRYTGDLKIEPALAESWETVSPTVWRFKLRQGVKFHNGNPFTADDVIASLARVTHETSPLKGNLPAYKSSKKIDDYTVELEVNGPYPLLLNDLTNIFIFDKEWMEANNSLLPTDSGKGVKGYATDNANGTGPFKVESRRADSRTVFVKNAAWWDKPKHNIDVIEFSPITSSSTRVAALLSGEIDYTNVAPLQDLPRLSASPDVKVLQTNELRSVFFALNLGDKLIESDVKDKNPFKDIRVREALYRAIDIDAVHKRAMRGLSRNTGALVAPAIPGYEPSQDERLPFDLNGAKKLLADAGYPNGFSFQINCQSDSLVNEEEFCQAVAAMWSRAGFKPNLSMAPRSQQTPKRVKGEFDVISFGWANEPMIDAYSLLVQVLRSKSGTGGVFNWGGWGDPRIDALIDKAGVELDTPKRIEMMKEALKIAKKEQLFIPLHQQPMAWAMRNTVASTVQASDNKPRLWLTMMK